MIQSKSRRAGIAQRPLHQFDADLPLGAVDHLVGDVGRPAAGAVVVPGVLRQVKLAVQQGAEVAAAHVQVDGDDAVVLLAGRAAVLVLHARRLVALLGHGGLVDAADDAQLVGRLLARGRQVLAGDATLDLVAHLPVVPAVVGEELLERADRTPAGQGDGLHALAGQVRQQPAGIGLEVLERGGGEEAGSKAREVFRERRPQRHHLLDSHGRPPCRLEVDTPRRLRR